LFPDRSVAISIAREWRTFRHDPPGERFENHYHRMRQQGSRAGAIARLALGVALIAAGIALLFVPGPGLLVLLFGFGLLGGESHAIARGLDRVEPALREKGRAARRWWRLAAWPMRAGVLALGVVAASALGYVALRVVS
jgi:hypothetical protein